MSLFMDRSVYLKHFSGVNNRLTRSESRDKTPETIFYNYAILKPVVPSHRIYFHNHKYKISLFFVCP